MNLLLDIGNTHTHVGLANGRRILRRWDLPTSDWFKGTATATLKRSLKNHAVAGAALCSVVPPAVVPACKVLRRLGVGTPLVLSPSTVVGVGIDYPKPQTIGADRLANAVAAKARFGAPVVVVDFGTAVTFDVINSAGNYTGGIIAPGLASMTDYLHEKTALLPRIRIRNTRAIVGRSTEQAMLIGAVHGYRGLVGELIRRLKDELKARQLPVVATGGYARLMAAELPEISAVEPRLTLQGLLITLTARRPELRR